MTGPEHYREAEQLLLVAHAHQAGSHGLPAEICRTEALVHATLALTAAYAEVNPTSAWHEVAGGGDGRE